MSPESYNQSLPASSRNSSIVSQSFASSFSDLLSEQPIVTSIESRTESTSSYRPSPPSRFALPPVAPLAISSYTPPTILPPVTLGVSPISPNAFIRHPRLPSPFTESMSGSSSPALSISQFPDPPLTARPRDSWLAGSDGMPRVSIENPTSQSAH